MQTTTEQPATFVPFNAAAFSDAYLTGQRIARDTIDGFYTFEGACVAAEARGYVRETMTYAAFVSGYLDAITKRFPRGVPVTPEGFIAAEVQA
jgi:hypothetical protein